MEELIEKANEQYYERSGKDKGDEDEEPPKPLIRLKVCVPSSACVFFFHLSAYGILFSQI